MLVNSNLRENTTLTNSKTSRVKLRKILRSLTQPINTSAGPKPSWQPTLVLILIGSWTRWSHGSMRMQSRWINHSERKTRSFTISRLTHLSDSLKLIHHLGQSLQKCQKLHNNWTRVFWFLLNLPGSLKLLSKLPRVSILERSRRWREHIRVHIKETGNSRRSILKPKVKCLRITHTGLMILKCTLKQFSPRHKWLSVWMNKEIFLKATQFKRLLRSHPR